MDSAPTVKYENADADRLCTICQENVKIGTRLCTTKCKHYFYPACLYQWMSSQIKRSVCICREPLDPDDLQPMVQGKKILHYETTRRATYVTNYTERVNNEADALIKYGEIHIYPIEWAVRILSPTGDVPKDKILEDRANRILAFFREEKRSLKSGIPTATRTNTIFTAPNTPAASMTEVQILSEGERYYMWVDLTQSVLFVGQAWL